MAKNVTDSPHDLLHEAVGIFWAGFSLLCFVSLISYSANDPSFSFYLSEKIPVHNYGGIIGAFLADSLVQIFGCVSYGVPLLILGLGFMFFQNRSWFPISQFISGTLLCIVSSSIFLYITFGSDPLFSPTDAGGLIGRIISEKIMVRFFSVIGAYIVLGSVFVLSLLLITRISLVGTVSEVGSGLFTFLRRVGTHAAGYAVRGVKSLLAGSRKKTKKKPKSVSEDLEDEEDFEEPEEEQDEEVNPWILRDGDDLPPISSRYNIPLEDKEMFSETFTAREIPGRSQDPNGYIPPPLSFLDDPAETSFGESEEELIKKSGLLQRKLGDFGIEGKIVQVLPGPLVTLYEFEPAPGVKVSRIVSLADDLALGMRAPSIRIMAPVPGKAVVGIEIPNSDREFVGLKQIINSDEFRKNKSPLTLCLGKDSLGRPVVSDLAQIPHLLIAGATGSGKSVGVNSMIVSMLFNASPQELNFIMIDPKMLELSVYDGIPHLISPVIVNPKKAANALRWAVTEMERRYRLMAEKGVRNITSYNRVVKGAQKTNTPIVPFDDAETGEGDAVPETPMPYIVIVIDELADLMLVSSKDVEDSLTRIAQMARASGIHLLVATQRPSVDVLTGIIKANFPARISFQVTSRVDSRTILDMIGAERLLGKGDMLFLPPGTSNLQRIHGAYISEEEIKRVVDYLKKVKKPVYQEGILEPAAEEETSEEDLEDECYRQAVDLVAKTQQASISMIQRRLRIGYNRAARIVELMERQGLVGPADGAKPREVFVRDTGESDPF